MRDLASLFCWFALCWPTWCQTPTDVQIQIDLDSPSSSPFLGVNAVYHGFAFMPEETNKGMTDVTRQLEFDRISRAGLHIARTFYRPDWACSAIAGPCDWNSIRMRAFYQWLAAMQSANVTVALNVGWWFPADTYYGRTQSGPADLATYAAWVSESVHQIIELRRFTNVHYLMVFTEPTTTASGVLPAGTDLWPYYVACVKALHQRLAQDGRRGEVLLVGPDNTSNGRDLDRAVSDLSDVLDIFSGHNYNNPGYDSWSSLFTSLKKLVAGTGKPLWIDEYGQGDESFRETDAYGAYIAQAVAASINAGAQTSLLWLLFDQQYVSPLDTLTLPRDSFYNGIHRWGVWRYPGDSLANAALPRPSWYAFSLMSRYLGGGPGTISLPTTVQGAGVHAAATSPNGSESSCLIVNGSAVIRTVKVIFSRPLRRALYAYSYTPGEVGVDSSGKLIPYGALFPDVGSNVTVSLGPNTVMLLSTIAGEAGTIPETPGDLTATAVGQSVILSWKDNSVIDNGIRIERKSADQSSFVSLRTVAAGVSTFVDSAVNTTIYQYRVCAFRTEGCSAYSSVATVTVGNGRGMLGWWPMAGDLADRTGQHSISGAASVAFMPDGRQGTLALHFNGANSFVDLDAFDVGDQFSLALWVKMDPSSNTQAIISNRKNTCTADGFTLSVNLFQTSSQHAQFGTGDGSACRNALTDPGAFPFGIWTHIAVTVDRKSRRAAIFLNGTEATNADNRTVLDDFSTSGTVRIGALLSNDYWFQGAVQDLRVFSYPLSQTDIQELAFAEPGPAPVITSVANGANFRTEALSPGAWISISGKNLGRAGTAPDTTTLRLGGASVSICAVAAVLSYNSGPVTANGSTGWQINALVPDGIGGQKSCSVVVIVDGLASQPATVAIQSGVMELFGFPSSAGPLPIITHADYSLVGPPSANLKPARPNETVVAWGTGDCSAPSVTVGRAPAAVVFSGRVAPGLCQINFTIPDIPAGLNSLSMSTSPAAYALWVSP